MKIIDNRYVEIDFKDNFFRIIHWSFLKKISIDVKCDIIFERLWLKRHNDRAANKSNLRRAYRRAKLSAQKF